MEFQKLIDKSFALTKLIIQDLLKFTNSEEIKVDALKTVYFQLLFKIIHAFEGALYLLAHFSVKPLFQITLISTIRDIISDIISAEYLGCKEVDKDASIGQ